MPRKLLILWIPKRNWNEQLTENIQIQHLRADQCEKNISFHTHLEVGTFWVMYTLRTIYSGKFIALFVVRQELQPWSESVMHQPIPLVPFHQELWGIWSRFRRLGRGKGGGGAFNLLLLHTKARYLPRPGTCNLVAVNWHSYDFNPARGIGLNLWQCQRPIIIARVRVVCRKSARFSWIWCAILHLCTTTASEF